MPAKASQRKLSAASPAEKLPVSAAAMAKRRQTRPDASLSSDSPSRMCIMRLGMGTRAAMADTAIGSVGETTAARAKATASGIAGIIQLMKKPMPMTVVSTSPSASSTTVEASLSSSSLGMRQPSRNSRGGRNKRRNISGSSATLCDVDRPMIAPRAIWTRGVGMEIGIMRDKAPLTTTASNRNNTTEMTSKSSLQLMCGATLGGRIADGQAPGANFPSISAPQRGCHAADLEG